MKRILTCLFILAAFNDTSSRADWDPKDETFDPSLQSVVIGDRSWIGDPSPFVHVGLKRTGYTYVMPTEWEGFDPSVQISLIVPLKPGETTPQSTGMLMMNRAQTLEFIKAVDAGWKTDEKKENTLAKTTKRVSIKSAFKDVDWGMRFVTADGQRLLQLDNKSHGKVNAYQLSIHASKKLIGALQHSLKKLEGKSAPPKPAEATK